mmetsp:Transcript_17554/g.44901  ORF Transcript_17554/g.44901 Transcript_17554/m.44901 type:complete len:241 (-) Transcript_17554:250-972(-)
MPTVASSASASAHAEYADAPASETTVKSAEVPRMASDTARCASSEPMPSPTATSTTAWRAMSARSASTLSATGCRSPPFPPTARTVRLSSMTPVRASTTAHLCPCASPGSTPRTAQRPSAAAGGNCAGGVRRSCAVLRAKTCTASARAPSRAFFWWRVAADRESSRLQQSAAALRSTVARLLPGGSAPRTLIDRSTEPSAAAAAPFPPSSRTTFSLSAPRSEPRWSASQTCGRTLLSGIS